MANPLGQTFDVFFSYNRKDSLEAGWLVEQLSRAGFGIFFDRYELIPGQQWRRDIEAALGTVRAVVVCVGKHGFGETQRWEIRKAVEVARASSDRLAIIVVRMAEPPASPSAYGELAVYTWVNLAGRRKEGCEELIAAIRGERPADLLRQRKADLANRPPFRGLNAFREDDAPYFFGRERVSDDLAHMVSSRRFVSLVGPSGSGKSSVVFAGVMPKLRRSENGRIWAVATLRPGPDPLLALAQLLAPTLSPQLKPSELIAEELQLRDRLFAAQGAAASPLPRLLRSYGETQGSIEAVLLVIDQFEEVFTLVRDDRVRERFIDAIEACVATSELPVHVLITLREDHEPASNSQPRLAALARQGGRVPLGPMTPADLRRAIEEPAAAVDLRFDDGLIDLILRDVEGQSNSLPLLEFLLDQLWQERDLQFGALSRAAYIKVGGVQQAIARHADAVYAALSPEDRALASALFLVLVRAGAATTNDARRPAELATLSEPLRRLALLLTGPQQRLLVADGKKVEITHEALLRAWLRLAQWVDDARDKLLLRERLENQSLVWDAETAQNPKAAVGRLLSAGVEIDEAMGLINDHPALIEGSPLIARFVTASEQSVRLAREVAEAGRAKASEDERRTNRLLNLIGLAAACAIAVVGAGGGYYYYNQNIANEQRRREAIEGRRVAFQASNTIVNRVSRDLGETEGVPSVAISNVLGNAREILETVARQQRDDEDPRQLKLVVADVMIQGASTNLTRGDLPGAEKEIAAADAQIAAVCGQDTSDRRCARRRAETRHVLAALALLSHPPAPQAARQHAAAAVEQLKPFLSAVDAETARLPKTPGLPASQFSRELHEDSIVDMILAAARAQTLGAQAVLFEIETTTVESREAALDTGLRDLDDPIRQLAALEPYAVDKSSVAIALASCYRVRTALLVARGRAADATKDADQALKILQPVRVAHPTNLAARVAEAEAKIARGAADAAGKLLARGPGETLPKETKDAKDPLAPLLAGFKDLRDQALANRDNYQMRSRFLHLWRLSRLGLTTLTDEWRATDGDGQILVREAVVKFALERLTSSYAVTEAEKAYLRAEALESAQWLLSVWSRNRQVDKSPTLDLAKELEETVLKGPLPEDGEASFLNKLRTQFWMALEYREKRQSHSAVMAFLAIDELLRPYTKGLNCNAKERTANERRFCFFSSYTVTFLGAEDTWKGAEEATIDSDLERSREITERLRNANTDNIEFQSALAYVKMRQGQRAEKRGEERKALEFYQEAAQLGSQDAVRLLRDWQQRNPMGRDGAAALAIGYEQRQRDLAPVVISLTGSSNVLRGSNTMFQVYLVPPQGGADPLAREVQRLSNYYGVTLDDASTTKFRDIITRATEIARKARRSYTSRDLREALVDQNNAEAAEQPYDSKLIDPALKEVDYALLNADFGKALEALDRARAEVTKAGTGVTARLDLEYEWGILGMKYLQVAEAARRRSAEDRGTGSVGTQMWSSVYTRANAQSDEAFGRSFSGEVGTLTTRSTAQPQLEPLARGRRLYQLANRMATIHDEMDRRGSYFYQDPQTYAERMNETIVYVLERAGALLKLSRSNVAGPTYEVDWYIVRSELLRGKALSRQTTNRPRPQDVLKIAKRGADFRGEAMDAYENALAHLTSFARAPGADKSLKQFEVEALVGMAETHGTLKEHDTAVRVLEKAIVVADEWIEDDRGNLAARAWKANAFEALAEGQRKLALLRLDAARDLWRAGGVKMFPNDNAVLSKLEGEARRQFDVHVERSRELYAEAQESYLRANSEHMASLRIDPDRCAECLKRIRTNVRRVAALIGFRMDLDFKLPGWDISRGARLEAKRFAEAMMNELRQSDQRVSNVRISIGSLSDIRADSPGTIKSPSTDAKRPAKVSQISTAPQIIEGVDKDPWSPLDLAKSLREQLDLLERQQGQLRIDRAETLATSKYVAVLAYELVAEFAIRTANSSDLHSAFRDASIIYKALIQELTPIVEISAAAANQYAVTLSDLGYALSIMSAREPALAREARAVSDQASNIDRNLYLREPNIKLNAAHVLLINKQFDEARLIYLSDDNWRAKHRTQSDWTWKNQLISDLQSLKSAFSGDAAIVLVINSLMNDANSKQAVR